MRVCVSARCCACADPNTANISRHAAYLSMFTQSRNYMNTTGGTYCPNQYLGDAKALWSANMAVRLLEGGAWDQSWVFDNVVRPALGLANFSEAMWLPGKKAPNDVPGTGQGKNVSMPPGNWVTLSPEGISLEAIGSLAGGYTAGYSEILGALDEWAVWSSSAAMNDRLTYQALVPLLNKNADNMAKFKIEADCSPVPSKATPLPSPHRCVRSVSFISWRNNLNPGIGRLKYIQAPHTALRLNNSLYRRQFELFVEYSGDLCMFEVCPFSNRSQFVYPLLGLLPAMDHLHELLALPPSSAKLPHEQGAPDFAWGDPVGRSVVAKRGQEHLFMTMAWRHDTNPGNVTIPYDPDPSYMHGDPITANGVCRLELSSPTVSRQGSVACLPKAGMHPLTTIHSVSFGPWLIAMNCDLYRGHEWTVPSDYVGKSGKEMVSPGGREIPTLPSAMSLAANQTVVIYVEAKNRPPLTLKTDDGSMACGSAPLASLAQSLKSDDTSHRGAATSKQPRPTVGLSVDLRDGGERFPHFWKRCFGSGHAYLGTRADWRQHLQLAVNELGVESIRMHGVLDDDMGVAATVNGTPWWGNYQVAYGWFNVDQVYDYMLSIGVRPVVELSFMPQALAGCESCPATDSPCRKNNTCKQCANAFGEGGSYKSIQAPPNDYNEWYKLVHAMASHMIERHGLAEVSTWHWEVWNEMWGMDYSTHYLPLFNASSRALKDVHKSLRVGGPSTMQTQHVQDLILDTARLGIAIDFISTHFYPSDPNCTAAKDEHNGISSSDPDCFAKVLNQARSFANEAGLPFLITEYKDGLQGGPGNATVHSGNHGDQSYAAAFVMRNIPQLTSLDMLSYWTFTDVFEEGWGMVGAPFHGQFGCMTKEGIRKPVWRAFQALHQAGDTLLNVSSDDTTGTITAFATTQSDGSGSLDARGLQVFVTNFWPMSGASANPKIPLEASVELTIKASSQMKLPSTAFLWRIDDNSTRAWAAWDEMGQPHYPTPVQLALLNKASEMQAEELTVALGGKVSFALPAYGVGILRFSEASY